MAQWITRLSSVLKDPGSNPTVGKIFFILKFSLLSLAAQHDNAIANEINRGIYLANTLFSLGNSMYLLVHLSFKITSMHSVTVVTQIIEEFCYQADPAITNLPTLDHTLDESYREILTPVEVLHLYQASLKLTWTVINCTRLPPYFF